MRIRKTAVAWMFLVWPLAGCSGIVDIDLDFEDPVVRGSGRIATESRLVRGFDGIDMRGVGRVVIEVTGSESVTVTADDNVLRYLDSYVSGGVLHLGVANGISVELRREIEYRVTVRDLRSLRVSGAAFAEVYDLDTPDFFLDLSGASRVVADGLADVLEIRGSGASSLDAPDLGTLETVAHLSGASSAVVDVRDYLEVHASGASWLQYRGDPEVRAFVSGASWVGRF